MHKAEPKHPDDQFEKVIVVLLSYTIVEVPTVVIEARCASVALAAMLGASQDVWVADLAVVFVWGCVECDLAVLAASFKADRRVLWVCDGRDDPIVACSDRQNSVYAAENYHKRLMMLETYQIYEVVWENVTEIQEIGEYLRYVERVLESIGSDFALLNLNH